MEYLERRFRGIDLSKKWFYPNIICRQPEGNSSKNKKLKKPRWRCYIHSQEEGEKTMHFCKPEHDAEEQTLKDRHLLVEYDADW